MTLAHSNCMSLFGFLSFWVSFSYQTYQQQPPPSAVPMKSQNVPSLKENAISAPIPASAATTANNFTNTLSGNGYSNNTPAMQYLPPGNTFPSNSYPVMSNPAPYNQPTNYQYQPHPPSSNKPPQMSLSSMSNFPTNTTTPNVYQNSNMNQPSGSSYNPHGNNVAPLSMSQVTNNQYNTTAAHGNKRLETKLFPYFRGFDAPAISRYRELQ